MAMSLTRFSSGSTYGGDLVFWLDDGGMFIGIFLAFRPLIDGDLVFCDNFLSVVTASLMLLAQSDNCVFYISLPILRKPLTGLCTWHDIKANFLRIKREDKVY